MDNITIPIAEHLPNNPPDLGTYVSSIVGVALSVAALAAFIFLVFGGIQWITAGGDKGKIEEARNRITNAIIGLAIVAASWAIFLLVDNFFGIGITGNGGGGGGTYTASGICPCGNGGCASEGQLGQLSSDSDCYQCTSSGWEKVTDPNTSCPAITCGPCQ
jgi:hypothetical protein